MDKVSSIHCYNPFCIHGVKIQNCTHEDCEDKVFFPQILLRVNGAIESFYCTRECKAAVVMPDYQETTKPRSIEEMRYRIQKMKQRIKKPEKSLEQLADEIFLNPQVEEQTLPGISDKNGEVDNV